MAGKFGSLIADAAYSLLKLAISAVMLLSIILFEWIIEFTVLNTVGSHNPKLFDEPPMVWVKVLTIWAIALVWVSHVIGQAIHFIWTHFR